jgi:hypothetical protein
MVSSVIFESKNQFIFFVIKRNSFPEKNLSLALVVSGEKSFTVYFGSKNIQD